MATILDIAKLAGVSQGTVSNVLNQKCNVSSEKIKKVMDAAIQLGYVPDERAKLLRKGHTNLLGIIVPNIHSKQYVEFYSGFKSYATDHKYDVLIQFSNENNPEAEIAAVKQIRSYMAGGIAVFTSFNTPSHSNPYTDDLGNPLKNEQLLFVDRNVSYSDHFIGFDYKAAGRQLAIKALEQNFSNICLLTGSLDFSNESDFFHSFMDTLSKSNCRVRHIQTDAYRKLQNTMKLFDSEIPQAVFISNYDFAEGVKDIYNTLFFSKDLPIYTVSPLFTMPENDFIKYELNYRKLGTLSAKKLIDNLENSVSISSTYLDNSGFRNWHSNIISSKTCNELNVLMLDTPTAYSIRHLSRLFTKHSGITVNITTYPYNEMYRLLSTEDSISSYDILRLDVTWLNWFSERILQPLELIDSSVIDSLSSFIPGTADRYSILNGHIYSLPFDPSIQLLFYRKDLFNDPFYKQIYWEKNKQQLKIPTSFDEYNKIAQFFTRKFNPISPVDYGTTLTLGSFGVACSEYLVRLFSQQKNLYNSSGKINLVSKNSVQSLNYLIDAKHYSDSKYSFWWTNTASEFAQGNVAMAILYSNFASNILNSSSKIIGNIGFTNTPGNNPAIGGGYLGVSKMSQHPHEALSFIRWACSEPIASARTALGSVSPCKLSYDNYEIINHYPWLNLAKNSFTSAHGYRIPPGQSYPFNEYEFIGILGKAIKNAYDGVQSVHEALTSAQKELEEHFQYN